VNDRGGGLTAVGFYVIDSIEMASLSRSLARIGEYELQRGTDSCEVHGMLNPRE